MKVILELSMPHLSASFQQFSSTMELQNPGKLFTMHQNNFLECLSTFLVFHAYNIFFVVGVTVNLFNDYNSSKTCKENEVSL
jgi:hypothetical protein